MKSYLNPTRRRSRGRIRRASRYIILTIFIGGAAFGGYHLYQSEWLRIQEIQISGQKELSDEEVRTKISQAALLMGATNIFENSHIFAWPKSFEFKDDPIIKSVAVERDWLRRTIEIHVVERQRIGIWCFQQSCYWFAEDGLLLGAAPETEGGLIMQVADAETEKLSMGTPVLRADQFKNFQSVVSLLKGLPLDYPLKVNRPREEIVAKVVDGPNLIFSLRFLPTFEIGKFLVGESAGAKINAYEYVDFSVEKRIYTKAR